MTFNAAPKASTIFQFSALALLLVGAAACSAKPLDETHTGELTDTDDRREEDNSPYDTYTIRPRKGDRVTVTKTAANPATLDTYLLIGAPDGSEVGQNDDCDPSAPEKGSCLNFEVVHEGAYEIHANALDDSGRGAYTLRITSAKP